MNAIKSKKIVPRVFQDPGKQNNTKQHNEPQGKRNKMSKTTRALLRERITIQEYDNMVTEIQEHHKKYQTFPAVITIKHPHGLKLVLHRDKYQELITAYKKYVVMYGKRPYRFRLYPKVKAF